MSDAALDAYAVLGVPPGASDAELRLAYRELVKRHHPDHNAGSPESAARFEQIQNAYAVITQLRQLPGHGVDERIAAIEAELARQKTAREAAARAEAARQAAAGAASAESRRPTPEELGYFTTEDSFTNIIDDVTETIAERLRNSDAKRQIARRLSDLFGRGD
jgi:curved DNA-binding protein CbpA